MDHLNRCIFFVLCTVPMALGCGMIWVGNRRKAIVQAILGGVLSVFATIGCVIFGLGMLLSLRWGYLLTGILISAPLAVFVTMIHDAMDRAVSNKFARFLLRFLLTVLHLAACVVCLRQEGAGHRARAIVMTYVCSSLLYMWLRVWQRRRAKKLAETPVMLKVAELCDAYGCVAIQLQPDRARLFDHLPNTDFCHYENYRSKTPVFAPPDHWAPWFRNGAWVQEVKYATFDYPAMTEQQLEICAQGLRIMLSGFRSCNHHSYHKETDHKAVYDEYGDKKIADGTITTTHLYDDQLLYKIDAYQAMKKAQKGGNPNNTPARRNSWE